MICKKCNGTGKVKDERKTGAAMKAKRNTIRYTLREVAASMGKSIGYVSDLEHGRRKWSSDLEAKYIKALGGVE